MIQDGTYYYFDCLDGVIGDKLLTLEECSRMFCREGEEVTEEQLKHIAADYEAELYRYTYKDGEEVEDKQLTRLAY